VQFWRWHTHPSVTLGTSVVDPDSWPWFAMLENDDGTGRPGVIRRVMTLETRLDALRGIIARKSAELDAMDAKLRAALTLAEARKAALEVAPTRKEV
jgi:hypothetical protein